MTKTQCYRHGEIAFCAIDKLPEGLKESKTNTLVVGSGNNPHTFKGGELYFKDADTYIFGYFVANNTKLYHPEHGEEKVGNLLEAKLPDGIYELRKQQEYINGEMKQVVD